MLKLGPIILIEDDQDDVDVLSDVLRELAIENELIWCRDGAQAFEFMKSTDTKPLMILSDVNMPGMTGLELRQAINNDPEVKRKCIPFVFMTTTASQHAIKEAYAMCVQGFFEKPASMENYKKLIKKLYDYWQDCRHPNE